MTEQEAYEATNPDPAAYGLPQDAPEDQVNERRVTAAQALLAGVRANEAYWNSRSPLEALAAKASGHASIGVPPDSQGSAGAVESGSSGAAIETTASASTETAAQSPPPAATPDNATATVATLRKQLSDAGIAPEA